VCKRKYRQVLSRSAPKIIWTSALQIIAVSDLFTWLQQATRIQALTPNGVSLSMTSLQHKQLERIKTTECRSRTRTSSVGSKSSIAQRTGADFVAADDEKRLKDQLSSPFVRQDIFYSGSVTNLQEYKTSPDMATYVKVIYLFFRKYS